jgi:uncharacterized protein YkwD
VLPAAVSAVVARAQAKRQTRRCADATLMPTPDDADAVASATLCVINAERAHHHLRPLRANAALAQVARGQSEDMVHGNYFADHSLNGRTPLERIVPAVEPARVARAGQNIGCGSGGSSTAAGIVRAWMQSPPHRRIILTGAYTQAGVGVTPSLPSVLELGSSGATYTLDVTALG